MGHIFFLLSLTMCTHVRTGVRLATRLDSDVCRRQILMYKDGLRAEGNKQFLIALDP